MKNRISVFCALLALALPFYSFATSYNIAGEAAVSASGELDGYPASAAVDGIARVNAKNEWRSTSGTTSWGMIDYPSLRLDWQKPHKINKVVLYDLPDLSRHVAGVVLNFSDSTRIFVNSIPNDGSPRTVEFPEKEVEWMSVDVSDADGVQVGLSEIEVYTSIDGTGDYVGKVNPYIETARGRYFFFATGSLPFGMISSAPLTRNKNQYGGGYNYNSTEVLGFPQLHDWMIGAVDVMPVCSEVDVALGASAWKSSFSHDGEIVRPGYHRLFLDKYNMWVEQTATDRVSVYRCTYADAASDAALLLNLSGYIGTTTMVNPKVERVDDNTFAGELTTVGRLWGGPDSVKVFFAVELDRPVCRIDAWHDGELTRDTDGLDVSTYAHKIYPDEWFSYWEAPSAGVRLNVGDVGAGDRLTYKIAISYVSRENALLNMQQECPGFDFDNVHARATEIWNECLGRIDVEGGTPLQREKFYTDLWHVLLGRHKINDINGEYPDYTQGQRDGAFTRNARLIVRRLPMGKDGKARFNMYNSDSFWLSQWNLNVLWGLAWPEVLDDFAASLVQYADNGGLIPRGPNLGGYSYIMTACPATSLITSAYLKGMMTKVEPLHAYKHLKRNHSGGGMMGSKEEIDFYERNGYFDGNAGITLEAAFQDWTLSQMADRLGKKADARYFAKRSSGWTSLYNSDAGLILPKDGKGDWLHTDLLDGWGWVEANAWQATWSVSHQLDRLAALMGGEEVMAARLNHAFEMAQSEDFLSGYGSGYISYANQPGLSNAHVFNRIGYGRLAQKWVRRVQAQAYGYNNPDRGYGGHDEDQGQMGATSALMAIGLFSVTGTASAEPDYDLTSPVFDKVTISLAKPYYKGDSLVIRTRGIDTGNYAIGRACINGRLIDPAKAIITHRELAEGGTIEIELEH